MASSSPTAATFVPWSCQMSLLQLAILLRVHSHLNHKCPCVVGASPAVVCRSLMSECRTTLLLHPILHNGSGCLAPLRAVRTLRFCLWTSPSLGVSQSWLRSEFSW